MKKVLLLSVICTWFITKHAHGEPVAKQTRPSNTYKTSKPLKWGICLGVLNDWKVGPFLEIPLGRAEQVKKIAGLQTALVYSSIRYPLTQPDKEYKDDGVCKFHYIAVPLRVNTYVDIKWGDAVKFKGKFLLSVGMQLAYLLGGETIYNDRINYTKASKTENSQVDDDTAHKTVKWADLKKKNASYAVHFLLGIGFEFADLFQLSSEFVRILTPQVGCSKNEHCLWSYQLGISYNLAKFL